MSNTGDFLDALLLECFGAPGYSSPQTSGPPTVHSLVDSVDPRMTLACQELLDSSVSRDSFAVVRVLDSRSVLLRMASLELKHRILGCKDALKCRGLVVGLA